jgi:hypothetical protein
MPPLVSFSGNLTGFEVGEVDKHLYASTLARTLAQIEVVSCFRNDIEPLFRLLSPIFYAMTNL